MAQSKNKDTLPKKKVENSTREQFPRAAYYSILSGTYASLASVLGKLSTDPRTFDYFHRAFSLFSGRVSSLEISNTLGPKLASVIRVCLFVAMFVANGLMWTNYTRALDSSVNSIRVVVLNNAVNMLMTAFFGYFLFDEAFSLLWWLGASFVVAGTVVISRADKNSEAFPSGTSEAQKVKAL
ncbi:hypothetical protein DSO57_1010325 [Entomophthora muscae]|uniref:Uncharacterized protein n=1 Tax=Entomophthora muscae TaxID=34485 RepID=A0ACC2THM5_9FUNG|nr:hypothetical protein DSO57_1010325 [Entomophthora muscae]